MYFSSQFHLYLAYLEHSLLFDTHNNISTLLSSPLTAFQWGSGSGSRSIKKNRPGSRSWSKFHSFHISVMCSQGPIFVTCPQLRAGGKNICPVIINNKQYCHFIAFVTGRCTPSLQSAAASWCSTVMSICGNPCELFREKSLKSHLDYLLILWVSVWGTILVKQDRSASW